MFQIFWARSSLWVPNLSLQINLQSIKLSVAPESTNMFLSALVYAVRNETGIFILWYRVIYTVLHLSVWMALPQAVGSEPFKNPPSWKLPGWLCPFPLDPCRVPGLLVLGLWLIWSQGLWSQGPLLLDFLLWSGRFRLGWVNLDNLGSCGLSFGIWNTSLPGVK